MKKLFIMFICYFLLIGCAAPRDVVSINNMYIGKKVAHLTNRDHLVMDAPFTYEDDYVGFNPDEDKCIKYMQFYCLSSTNPDNNVDLSDIKLIYNGQQLETTEDVIECFGQNYIPSENEKYESFVYETDTESVYISLVDGEFNGIEVTKK